MKINLTLPKSWHQLTPGQFLAVSKFFLKGYTDPELLSQCFLLFSGWKPIRWRMIRREDETLFMFRAKKTKPFWISSEQFQHVARALSWITEGFGLPSETPAIRSFVSPDLRLYNTTLEQFLMAENYLAAFLATKKENYLNSFLAVYYLRKGEKFNSNKVKSHTGRFWFVRKFRKQAALMWFVGIKSWLVVKYPYVFSTGSAPVAPDESVLNLLSNLNGGDVTKNEMIMKSHVHEALHELNILSEYQKIKQNVRTV